MPDLPGCAVIRRELDICNDFTDSLTERNSKTMATSKLQTLAWTLATVLVFSTQGPAVIDGSTSAQNNRYNNHVHHGTEREDILASVDQLRLMRYLFDNQTYDPSIRPVYDPKTVSNLELQFFLSQVLNVDERLQTLKMNVWLTIRWRDEFLIWDPDDYNGLTNFKISKSKVWMPDIWLYQNGDNKYEDFTFNSRCRVYHYGEVLWAAPAIIKSHCKMDVWNFPFDQQTCNVTFGPWLHNASELVVNGTGLSDYFEGDTEWQLWDLQWNNYEMDTQYYPDYPIEFFSKVDYVVYLKRLPTYYVFYLIMPCSLISTITLLGFFLPVESGEKVGLGITVLLSLTVYLLLLAETLPPMKNAVPILGQYYAAVMVLVSLSIAMSVSVLNLHFRGPDSRPVPPWMRRMMLGKVARFVMIRQVSTSTNKDRARRGYLKDKKLEFLPMMDLADPDAYRVNGLPHQAKRLAHHSPKSKPLRNHHQHHPPITMHPKGLDEHIYFLRELLHEVKGVKSMLDGQKKDDARGCEWKQVALVLDRVFLFLYLVGSISTVLVILFQIEYDSGPSPLEIKRALEEAAKNM